MKTSLWVLLFLCSTMLFGEVLFYDDFDRNEGEAVGNGWTNIGPVNPIIENGGMKVVSNSLQGVRRDFSTLGISSGIYYVSWDWKIGSNNWLADAFPNGTITYLRHDYEGNLYYDNTSDFSNPIQIGSLAFDTWANFKLKVNIDTDRFSIWVNNTLVADNIAGLSVTDFTRFTFRAGSGSTVTQYIDNFIVYNDTPPATPTNLTATGAVNDITLNWDTATNTNFLTYKIYRSTTSPATTLLTEIPGIQNQYVDSSILPNTVYYYRIKSVAMNTHESDFSNEVSSRLIPQIQLVPNQLNLSVGYGYNLNTSLCIQNTGGSDLFYSIEDNPYGMYGNGADGNLNIQLGQTFYTDVVRSSLTGIVPQGVNNLMLTNNSGFNIGDEVLIISMQDPSMSSVGQFETHRITGINGNQLFLNGNLLYGYDSVIQKNQVIKVFNYENVEINGNVTCANWDGTTGGVLFFKVKGTLLINPSGTISATGKGYRGGAGTFMSNGKSGEGIQGNYPEHLGPSYGGGAGGFGGSYSGDPGNGGGYGSSGIGGHPLLGGQTYGDAYLNNIYLGSGGGASGSNSGSFAYGANGGNGGGVVYIYAYITNNMGIVSSNGSNGNNGSSSAANSGGAGGAGGTVLIISDTFFNNGTITAQNGIGGLHGYGYYSGNNGGVGRIKIQSSSLYAGNVNPLPLIQNNVQYSNLLMSGSNLSGTIEPGNQITSEFTLQTYEMAVGVITDTLFVLTNIENNSVTPLIINITILPPEPIVNYDTSAVILNYANPVKNVQAILQNNGYGKFLFSITTADSSIVITPLTGIIEVGNSSIIYITINGSVIEDGVHYPIVSISSNAVSPNDVIELMLNVHVDKSPPLAPLGLSFDEIQSDMNQIYLSWTANALADSVYSYKIYRRGLHDTLWALRGTVDAEQTWFIDNQFTGLDTTAVYYKVTAVDWVDNESTASEEVMAWLQRFPAPTGLNLEIIRDRHVKLSWNPVTQTISGNSGTPSCYVIYRSYAPSPLEDFYFVGAVDDTTFTHNWAAWFIEQNKQFYLVTAYSGSFEDIRAVAESHRDWKYGELDKALKENGVVQINLLK